MLRFRSKLRFISLLPIATTACQRNYPSPRSPVSPPSAILPYVDYLGRGVQAPVDYVIKLFDDHDLVIICERAHPEATQYDLLFDLVRDPRFVRRVGTIFTEVGTRSIQPELDSVLTSGRIDTADATHRLIEIYRNIEFFPVWDNFNFYNFLSRVRRLNASLVPPEQLRVVLTDVAFRWEETRTPEEYHRFRESLGRRDRLLADLIIEQMKVLQAGPRPKALVIMNFRHAFNDFTFDDGKKGDNVGRYLFEAFPGRVANVMLNSVAVEAGSRDNSPVIVPIQRGKWDAAFLSRGISSGAFDFHGSPFGRDTFDFFPFGTRSVTYEDVFNGFVYYRRLNEHVFLNPVPGLVDDIFLPELRRRFAIASPLEEPLTENKLDTLRRTRPVVTTYSNLQEMEALITAWLR